MDAAMVIGLTNPQGGSVKRSDYNLKDGDYVIRAGDTPDSVASAMKIPPSEMEGLGEFQQGDVMPGVQQGADTKVDPNEVSQDPKILSRLAEMGVQDPYQLSAEDYVSAQMLVFNGVLESEKEMMGEAFNEADAIKGLAEQHPKQLASMFRGVGKLKEEAQGGKENLRKQGM